MHVEDQLSFSVYATMLAFNKAYKRWLGPHDLTYPQYLVMLVLWESDAISVSDIGARLYLDSGTLTPLLKRLESAGFVRRTRYAGDERVVLITVTAEGHALRIAVMDVADTMSRTIAMPANEKDALRGALDELRQRLS